MGWKLNLGSGFGDTENADKEPEQKAGPGPSGLSASIGSEEMTHRPVEEAQTEEDS